MILPTEITCGNLPLNFSDSPLEYFRAILNRLRGFVPDDQVITGHTLTTDPIVDLGPWLRQDPLFSGPTPPVEWWVWVDGAYRPMPYFIGDEDNYVTLEAAPTATRAQTLPDKAGTIALLYDIYVPRPTVILSGATPTIDFSAGDHFIHRLTSDASCTLTGLTDGGRATVAVQNNGTSFTVSFHPGASISWANGGTPPVQPAGAAGKNAIGIYRFKYVINTVYADLVGTSSASPSPSVDTDPGDTAPPTYGQPSIQPPAHFLP